MLRNLKRTLDKTTQTKAEGEEGKRSKPSLASLAIQE
jgi:hypothetical protein